MLGHELRNPLAPIVTALQLMKLRGDGTVAARARRSSSARSTHMMRLVDDLLDVSRIARGKIELKRERVELREVDRQGDRDREPAARAARPSASSSTCRRRRWSSTATRRRLAQVFANLLTNAAKYTEPGGHDRGRRSRDAGDDDRRSRCATTASASRRELLPRVFELFVQGQQGADRARRRARPRAGARAHLVELHGGTVDARSDGVGRGSAFTVRLPRRRRPGSRRADARRAARRRLRGAASARAACSSSTTTRTRASCSPTCCARSATTSRPRTTGRRALALVAASSTPEVAILDIGLPVMDGYELAAALRERTAATAARLIALTGYGQRARSRAPRAAGFDATSSSRSISASFSARSTTRRRTTERAWRASARRARAHGKAAYGPIDPSSSPGAGWCADRMVACPWRTPRNEIFSRPPPGTS